MAMSEKSQRPHSRVDPSSIVRPLPVPGGEFLLYQTADGRTRIQCRLVEETIWLTQALIAELFQKDVRTINEHLINIFEEKELSPEATIRKFRMVRTEGRREVSREVDHYRTSLTRTSLPASDTRARYFEPRNLLTFDKAFGELCLE